MSLVKFHSCAALGAALLLGVLHAETALAVPRVFAVDVHRDVTDLGPSGLNIGSSGYWFANFAATQPVVGAAPGANHANALPRWVLVDFEPTSDPERPPYSFSLTPGDDGPDAFSTGGQPDYNLLTLPGSVRGLSGQLVDTGVGPKKQNTLIKTWEFGPGAPSKALVHVVLDNAPLSARTAVDRLRLTHVNAEGGIKDRASFDDLTASNNGTADVYTFRLEGIEVGGSITVQLHTAADGSTEDAGLAGIALDAIEFPPRSSGLENLFWPGVSATGGVALVGIAYVVRRRKRRRRVA